jgi:hypothetical protein
LHPHWSTPQRSRRRSIWTGPCYGGITILIAYLASVQLDGNLKSEKDFWALLVQIVGFGGVAFQLNRARLDSQATTHGVLYQHYLRINEILLDRPKLRPYFYDKEMPAPQSKAELQELEPICELMAGTSIAAERAAAPMLDTCASAPAALATANKSSPAPRKRTA